MSDLCRKLTYRNKAAALAALAMWAAKGGRVRFVYECPRCGGFHLTSKDQRPPKR